MLPLAPLTVQPGCLVSLTGQYPLLRSLRCPPTQLITFCYAPLQAGAGRTASQEAATATEYRCSALHSQPQYSPLQVRLRAGAAGERGGAGLAGLPQLQVR